MTARVWLFGEHNPYGADPAFALYPLPPNAAGGRLARVLGLSADEYLAAFERRNLLDTAGWRAGAGRPAPAHPRGDRLVLLGARVAAAFGCAFGCAFRSNLCEPRFMQVGTSLIVGRGVLVLPHPSGLSRLWNDPSMPGLVRSALERLCGPLADDLPVGYGESGNDALGYRFD